jgi:hypothetical protein
MAAPALAAGTAGRATLLSYAPTAPRTDVGLDGVVTMGATAHQTSAAAARLSDTMPVRATAGGRGGVVLRRPDHLVSPLADAGAGSGDPASGRRKYLPVLLSALVPGAGEVSMGYYKRGIALMAVEAGAWSGYLYKHNQGLDTRDEYEAFADAHWDQGRWIDNHYLVYPDVGWTLEELEQRGRDTSGSGVWPGYSPWVSRESDKQHYYENIGKYDWYVSGWADYAPGTTPDDLAPGGVLSELREEYRDMRHESNTQLDAANRFIYLSIAARVFSLVETTMLVNRSPDERAGGAQDNRWMLRARARGNDASEVALEYWFK